MPPNRVTRAYPGIRETLRPLPSEQVTPVLQRLGLPANYFLHVGTIEPRKNLLMLLRAYTSLPKHLRDRCPLVLVGPWGWGFDDVASFFEGEAKQQNVRHLGYVAEQDLPAIYNGARRARIPDILRRLRPARRGDDGLWRRGHRVIDADCCRGTGWLRDALRSE